MFQVNEKYCSWMEVFFFQQNSFGVYKVMIEHRDNRDSIITIEDINCVNISERIYGDDFHALMRALKES